MKLLKAIGLAGLVATVTAAPVTSSTIDSNTTTTQPHELAKDAPLPVSAYAFDSLTSAIKKLSETTYGSKVLPPFDDTPNHHGKAAAEADLVSDDEGGLTTDDEDEFEERFNDGYDGIMKASSALRRPDGGDKMVPDDEDGITTDDEDGMTTDDEGGMTTDDEDDMTTDDEFDHWFTDVDFVNAFSTHPNSHSPRTSPLPFSTPNLATAADGDASKARYLEQELTFVTEEEFDAAPASPTVKYTEIARRTLT
jgi:hypothetical protein